MALLVSKYPKSIVFLDGEKIVEFYNWGDKRNIGECIIEDDESGKSYLKYNNYTFDVNVTISVYDDTKVIRCETINNG